MLRKAMLIPLMIAAVAVPYMISEDGWRKSLSNKWAAWWSSDNSAGQSAYRPFGGGGQPSVVPTTVGNPLSPEAMHDMYSAIRFDRSPSWVTSNWSRVSIFDAEEGLRGLRVTLVTGTRPDDLVGALTYYFDEDEKLQRLTFQGTTSDQRRLAKLLTSKFHLQREASYGTGLYVSKWHGEALSVLRVTPPSGSDMGQLGPVYGVSFELNWPTPGRGLSANLRRVVGERTS